MDGVIADLDGEMLVCLTERQPGFEARPRTNWYMSQDYPEFLPMFDQIIYEPGFFARLPIAEFALEGLQRIIDLGYEPRICSTILEPNPTCEADKRLWLERNIAPHIGKFISETPVFTADKYTASGFAIIEDRPVMPNATEAEWTHIIFDKLYNQGHPGFRLHGWLDENLDMILSQLSQTVGG